ncbi:hypothetical protein LCGC14_2366860 [marine sediment metagenome]|uniref:Uncharacterized protein n=1 Tax=marine sediment metagenome TaxID=412755 RepID=A0A0F9C4X3_9ZZZZ
MRIVSVGAHHVSYIFMPGETIPAVLPRREYPFKKCSHCNAKGVFDYK